MILQKNAKIPWKTFKAILFGVGMTFENVVNTSIFISDLMKQNSKINEFSGAYLDTTTAPSRETAEVVNLPK